MLFDYNIQLIIKYVNNKINNINININNINFGIKYIKKFIELQKLGLQKLEIKSTEEAIKNPPCTLSGHEGFTLNKKFVSSVVVVAF